MEGNPALQALYSNASAAETPAGASSPDDGLYVAVPRHVILDILADGCCPLQFRLQLQAALAGESASLEGGPAFGQSGSAHAPSSFPYCCGRLMASFLEFDDFLVARAAGSSLLCELMQRDPENHGSSCAFLPADLDDEAQASAEDPTEVQEADIKGAVRDVRDRLRVRLWMLRVSIVSAGTADERVFETHAKRFWEDALRRRLEGEVAAAKNKMEEEVRVAKANMLECVQSISDEVDERVHSKVADLQQEFDRRASEQARGLQEMVERRVQEQTAALQAEVDRRTEVVRAAVEQRTREQEQAALRLQAEVARMRASLEARVYEQEEVAARLGAELSRLRQHLLELTDIRDKLEARLQETEAADATSRTKARPGGTPLCFPWLQLRWRNVRGLP